MTKNKKIDNTTPMYVSKAYYNTLVKETDGRVIPMKKPKTIATIVVMISFAFSFVLLGAPLPKRKKK